MNHLGRGASNLHITALRLLGGGENVRWQQGDDALLIEPVNGHPTADAIVFKAELALQ